MTYSLNTNILEPLIPRKKPKNAVILCHGYGGDGKDIAILARIFGEPYLPETIFICPDAPEKCAASPMGLPIMVRSNGSNIQSKFYRSHLVAENNLTKLIDEVITTYNSLTADQIIIGGF